MLSLKALLTFLINKQTTLSSPDTSIAAKEPQNKGNMKIIVVKCAFPIQPGLCSSTQLTKIKCSYQFYASASIALIFLILLLCVLLARKFVQLLFVLCSYYCIYIYIYIFLSQRIFYLVKARTINIIFTLETRLTGLLLVLIHFDSKISIFDCSYSC